MQTLWQKRTQLPAFPQLSGEERTDVLVIGGGMAGLLTAWYLRQKGIDTILVEKERLCSGTTAGTTAKLTAQHGLIYHKILRAYGEESAKMYYRANTQAVKELKKLCEHAGCDLENKDNFVYSSDLRKLEKEWSALQALGIPAKVTDRLPLPIDLIEAIGFENQGQFDPLQLAVFLAKDLKIYEKTRVTELLGTTAVTDRGKIQAKKIVVATHFPFLNKHGSYFLKLYQHRSYVLALKGAETFEGMYVDEADKGLSFRSYNDLLLLGGGGHRTGKRGGNWAELTAFAQKHYPNAGEVCRWATQDCMSLDGVPYIGPYSKNTPQLYVASGFNKWGMTSAMAAAMILCDLVQEKENPWAEIFSPSRSILRPQLLVNALESTVHLLTPTAPRCPHMGCALKWNPAEHSWDCPCHGSRFSEEGALRNGPATGGLKRRKEP